MSDTVVQVRGKGAITLPAEMRRTYQVNEGDVFTVTALGEGTFLLTPRVSKVQQLGERISEAPEDALAWLRAAWSAE